MFDTYSDIIMEVVVASEGKAREHGFRLNITGGSQQSCSTYFSLHREREVAGEYETQHLSVRISDHSHRRGGSDINFHVGLFSDHGHESISANRIYERDICEFDDDDELISDTRVRCDQHDEHAELVGFEVEDQEISRVADTIVSAALAAEWE